MLDKEVSWCFDAMGSGIVCLFGFKIEFYTCARVCQKCDIFYYYWWTTLIKLRQFLSDWSMHLGAEFQIKIAMLY